MPEDAAKPAKKEFKKKPFNEEPAKPKAKAKPKAPKPADVKLKLSEDAQTFMDDVESEGDKWLEGAKKISGKFLTDLKGAKKDLAIAVIRDMAKIKIKASKGQHVGRELAHCESTLQDLAAATSLKAMQGLNSVAQTFAGSATVLFSSMFGRILNRF